MGKRGPPREPTALRLLKGRRHRATTGAKEPQLPVPAATCPRGLKRDARRIWDHHAKMLISAGVLTSGDLDHFRDYCKIYGEVLELERKLNRLGYENAKKLGVRNDLTKMRDQLLRYRDRLGLNPSARSGVKAAPTGVPDETEEFLFGHRRSS